MHVNTEKKASNVMHYNEDSFDFLGLFNGSLVCFEPHVALRRTIGLGNEIFTFQFKKATRNSLLEVYLGY